MIQWLRKVSLSLLELTGLRLLLARNCPRGTSPVIYRDVEATLPKDLAKTAMLDVGANFGSVTADLLKIFSVDVHAFEPSPAVFEALQRRHASNPRVHCHRKAISDKPGKLGFEPRPDEPGMGRLADAATSRATILVEVDTVDTFLAAQEIECVPLMKTDTEGFEMAVMEGAEESLRSGKIKSVLVEISPGSGSHRHVPLRRLQEHLEARGYRLFGLYDHGYRSSGECHFCNVLFKHSSVLPSSERPAV